MRQFQTMILEDDKIAFAFADGEFQDIFFTINDENNPMTIEVVEGEDAAILRFDYDIIGDQAPKDVKTFENEVGNFIVDFILEHTEDTLEDE